MKIGFFTNSYRPLMYGSATSIENFRMGLEKLGHEVYVFAPKFGSYKQENPRVIEYPSILYGYRIKYPLPFTWCPSIHKKAQKIGLDVIHSHHPFSIGQDGLRIARKLSLPIVFTHHARYADYSHYILPILPQALIKKIIQGKVTNYANKCDRVIAPSNSIKDYIQANEIITKTDVISTGIDWGRFQTGDGRSIRNKLGIKTEAKVVLNLGRLDQEKNLGFLSEAVYEALKKDQDAVFLLVGEGAYAKVIRKKAEEQGLAGRVIFAGLVDQMRVQDYYSAGNVFVCASLTETQGMTITEAKAAGLPIVALDGTGIRDQIENGKTGFLVKEGKGHFAEKLELLLEDSILASRLGSQARESAKEMDFLSQARKLEKIYLEEIDKKIKGKSIIQKHGKPVN